MPNVCDKEKSRDAAGPSSAVVGWVFLGIAIPVFLFSILLLVGVGIGSSWGHGVHSLGYLILEKGLLLAGPLLALAFCVASFRRAGRADQKVLRVASLVVLFPVLAYLLWFLLLLTGQWFMLAFNISLCAASLVVLPLAACAPQRVPAWVVHAVAGTILCLGGIYAVILPFEYRLLCKIWDKTPWFVVLVMTTIGLAVLSSCSWFVYLKRRRATRKGELPNPGVEVGRDA